jgi:hypothetical protein
VIIEYNIFKWYRAAWRRLHKPIRLGLEDRLLPQACSQANFSRSARWWCRRRTAAQRLAGDLRSLRHRAGATNIATVAVTTALVAEVEQVYLRATHAVTTRGVYLTITPPEGNHVASFALAAPSAVGGGRSGDRHDYARRRRGNGGVTIGTRRVAHRISIELLLRLSRSPITLAQHPFATN